MDYTPDFEAQIRAWARRHIDAERWDHVCGVVEMATSLAERYAPDERARVRLAGWIHDAAKNWDDSALLTFAEVHVLPITALDREIPMLLHGLVGYALAAVEFGLDDDQLCGACAGHTTGFPNMTAPEKIVFVADYAEPGRPARRADPIRRAAVVDLDTAVLRITDNVITYLLSKHRLIDPRTVDLRNELIRAGVRYEK
jgi:predicted HD superfamily hydrolase involved in NAD metabolism